MCVFYDRCSLSGLVTRICGKLSYANNAGEVTGVGSHSHI